MLTDVVHTVDCRIAGLEESAFLEPHPFAENSTTIF
jgi:hypothetical protein